jgi:hypothetical protein
VPRPTSWNVALKRGNSQRWTNAPEKLRGVRAVSSIIEELKPAQKRAARRTTNPDSGFSPGNQCGYPSALQQKRKHYQNDRRTGFAHKIIGSSHRRRECFVHAFVGNLNGNPNGPRLLVLGSRGSLFLPASTEISTSAAMRLHPLVGLDDLLGKRRRREVILKLDALDPEGLEARRILNAYPIQAEPKLGPFNAWSPKRSLTWWESSIKSLGLFGRIRRRIRLAILSPLEDVPVPDHAVGRETVHGILLIRKNLEYWG